MFVRKKSQHQILGNEWDPNTNKLYLKQCSMYNITYDIVVEDMERQSKGLQG